MPTRDDSEEACGSQHDDAAGGTPDEPFPNVPGGDLSMIGGDDGYTWYDMRPFWVAYHPWLAARGFHLFERLPHPQIMGYIFPPPTQCPPALPYAVFADIPQQSSIQIAPPAKFAPARDSLMRDVMVKLVKKGSDEHRIYEELLHCSDLSGRDFQGILPPVAILDSQYDFSFVVMPRWGDCAPLGTLKTVGRILSLIRCLLKGLAFLHSRRIVHRDIDRHNIMVNFYAFGLYRDKFFDALEKHRRGPDSLHCLVDFDRSLKLPLSTPLDTCRLVADAAMVSATPYQPPDLNLAEHDYNPFAYDVGCLGNMFRINYADIVPIVPMLAPLFDRMTTHVISERFKAASALAFFEDATRQLPRDVLDMQVEVEPDWDYTDSGVYWSKLPPDFCTTPGVYRTPPPSLARRLLNETINPLFTEGTIVALSNEIHVPSQGTPTKVGRRHQGQGLPNHNASTQVKIYLWRQETSVITCHSPDGGKRYNSIQDKHLVKPVTGRKAPRGGWELGEQVMLNIPPTDAVSYTTTRVSLPNDPRGPLKFPIRNGTIGVVTKCMTATNRARTAQQEQNSAREDWWYVIQMGLRKTDWQWVKCQDWIPANNLEPLHPQHPDVVALHNLIVATTDLPPEATVVSITTPGQ
ncbi:hypothetical protein V8D89_003767 [Ganoderma adspersum]